MVIKWNTGLQYSSIVGPALVHIGVLHPSWKKIKNTNTMAACTQANDQKWVKMHLAING